jgi:hypothetical protein
VTRSDRGGRTHECSGTANLSPPTTHHSLHNLRSAPHYGGVNGEVILVPSCIQSTYAQRVKIQTTIPQPLSFLLGSGQTALHDHDHNHGVSASSQHQMNLSTSIPVEANKLVNAK